MRAFYSQQWAKPKESGVLHCTSVNTSPICEVEGCSNQEPLSLYMSCMTLKQKSLMRCKSSFPMNSFDREKVGGEFMPFGHYDTLAG